MMNCQDVSKSWFAEQAKEDREAIEAVYGELIKS